MSKDQSPVLWELPRWAADLIRETIGLDAKSSAFDPQLRRELSQGLDAIKEAAAIECSRCHQWCAAEQVHLHQGRYICDGGCWDDRLKASE